MEENDFIDKRIEQVMKLVKETNPDTGKKWSIRNIAEELDMKKSTVAKLKKRGEKKEEEDVKVKAEQGDADAQNELGCMYHHGEGVIQDDSEAVKWFRLAVEQKHADAQFNLGAMYALGEGVTKDYTEAMKWYRLAAKQKHALAQTHLGYMYKIGSGVHLD